MNKGENMKKMLKIVALLSVMIGNFAIIQLVPTLLQVVTGKAPSFNGGYTHDITTVHMIL